MGKFSKSLTRGFERSFLPSAQRGGQQFSYDQRAEAELLEEQAKAKKAEQDELEKQDWIEGLRKRGVNPNGQGGFDVLIDRTPAHPDFRGNIKNWQKNSEGQWERNNQVTPLPHKIKPGEKGRPESPYRPDGDYSKHLLEGLKWFSPGEIKSLDSMVNPKPEEEKLPTITQSDFKPVEEVDKDLAKKFPGQLVEVTTKKKGDQVISTTYGNPISNERGSTKTGNGSEYKSLSDYEKSIMTKLDKEWVHNNSAKRVAGKYGEALFEYVDDDGMKWTETLPYDSSERVTESGRVVKTTGVKDRVEQIRRRQIATVTQLIGDEKLTPFNEIDEKYNLDSFTGKSPNELTKEQKLKFRDSALEFKESIRNAYRNGEIDEADFFLYKRLINRIYDMDYNAIQ